MHNASRQSVDWQGQIVLRKEDFIKKLTMPDVMRVAQIQKVVSAVLEEEQQLREEDIMTLFSARGADFDLVCEAAGRFLFSVSC